MAVFGIFWLIETKVLFWKCQHFCKWQVHGGCTLKFSKTRLVSGKKRETNSFRFSNFWCKSTVGSQQHQQVFNLPIEWMVNVFKPQASREKLEGFLAFLNPRIRSWLRTNCSKEMKQCKERFQVADSCGVKNSELGCQSKDLHGPTLPVATVQTWWANIQRITWHSGIVKSWPGQRKEWENRLCFTDY